MRPSPWTDGTQWPATSRPIPLRHTRRGLIGSIPHGETSMNLGGVQFVAELGVVPIEPQTLVARLCGFATAHG